MSGALLVSGFFLRRSAWSVEGAGWRSCDHLRNAPGCDLAHWLDQAAATLAGEERVILCGHSFGGYLAQCLAARLGERAAHLYLFSALVSEGGGAPLGVVLLVVVLACLLADVAWYLAGRRYGGFLLRSICKVSLSQDSCIRQSQNMYLRVGPRALLMSKFLPGASALSTTLAGMTRTHLRRFLAYDAAGSALWAGSALLLGVIFSDAVDHLLALLSDYAAIGALLIAGAFAAFIAWKLWQRQRLLSRSRRIPRISVEELENLREQGQLPVILDVRAHHEDEPSGIPGAIPVELNVSLKDLPGDLRDASIVIYCACPHELSAAMLAQRLNASGFTRTWALAGGLDAWRKAYGQVVANA